MAALRHATDHAQEAIETWKTTEPRVFGHLIAGTDKLFNLKSKFQHMIGSLPGADAAAELFLNSGLDRWEKGSRIDSTQAAELRPRLASDEAKRATKRMGVHLVMSVVIALPIAGIRSLARFFWTLFFWGRTQFRRVFRRGDLETRAMPNVHTPLVMVLSLIPLVGGVAYLMSTPLRSRILIRLMLDQTAWKLPFKLYRRAHIGRLLAPRPK